LGGTRATKKHNARPPKKFQGEAQAGGQKGRGSGGRNFCPLALPAEGGLGDGKAFLQFCVSRISKQKNFRFLN